MQTMPMGAASERYAKCIEVSKRIRWDIDRDVLRARQFDYSKKFLPDGLSKIGELEFLDAAERRLVSQIQGRTYANIFGLVERYISVKMLDLSRDLKGEAALEMIRLAGVRATAALIGLQASRTYVAYLRLGDFSLRSCPTCGIEMAVRMLMSGRKLVNGVMFDLDEFDEGDVAEAAAALPAFRGARPVAVLPAHAPSGPHLR